MYVKLLSAIPFTRELMNPHSGMDDNKKDNNKRIAKSIAAIPLAGIVIAAAFLSGLSLINSYQPAIAQQNMTGNATTTATTTNATTAGSGGISAQSACAPTQTGGGASQNATTTNSTTTGGGSANATTGNATTATNATTSAAEGGNQSISEIREYIEAACMAAQNNDTQGVLMQLNLALNELGGNMTSSEGSEDEGEGSEDEGEGSEDEGEGSEDEGEAGGG
jgi:hypothetical protein